MKILLTTAKEDAGIIVELMEKASVEWLHFPLEVYKRVKEDALWEEVLENLDQFENIVYGNLRNARFFVDWAEQNRVLSVIRERVNLALDDATTNYLEVHGIPAIRPPESKPISLVELMLRLKRLGPTLYPTRADKKEEVPGFLGELDIPVNELELFSLEGPAPEQLEEYRSKLAAAPPDIIVFHTRRSVTRTLVAFPALDLSACTILSAGPGVTRKLEKEGITIDAEAEESWASIAGALKKLTAGD